MRSISNTTRSDCQSQTFRETRSISETTTGKKFTQDLIRQANTVALPTLFKYYGLLVNEHNRKITCPFSFHKGGQEESASFWFYPQTNTFWCFGCKTGVTACDFVAAMDEISKSQAASKILEKFQNDLESFEALNSRDLSERLQMMLEFSKHVSDFRKIYIDEKSFIFIEKICEVYDDMNAKHILSNEALRIMTDYLKEKIDNYII